jgi:hypothetical protein
MGLAVETPRRGKTNAPRFGLLLLSFALAGCERGCIWKWLGDHKMGDQQSPIRGSLVPQEVDCPDGLARCDKGVIQVSRTFRHPDPCQGSVEQCSCPWVRLGACVAGCAADGVMTEMAADRALSQLCVPQGAASFATGPRADVPAASGASCDEEAFYSCVESAVVACHPLRSVAVCSYGCMSEGATLDVENLTTQAAVAILCARGPASK